MSPTVPDLLAVSGNSATPALNAARVSVTNFLQHFAESASPSHGVATLL